MDKLSNSLLKLMSGKDFRPMNAAEISRELNLQMPKRSDLMTILRGMKKEGKVKELRGARFELAKGDGKKAGGEKKDDRVSSEPKPKKTVVRRSGGRVVKSDSDEKPVKGGGERVKRSEVQDKPARRGRGDREERRGRGRDDSRSEGGRRGGKERGGRKSIQMLGTIKFQSNGDAWCYLATADEANLATGFDMDKIDRVRILGRDSGVSLDGDFVLIKIEKVGPPAWTKFRGRGKKGEFDDVRDEASGRVVKVLERKNPNVIGIYRGKGRSFYVEPDANYIKGTIKLKEKCDARSGQVVAVEILEWEHPETSPIGRVTKVLGWPDDPGVDIISVIHKHGLQVEFPKDVLAEADAVGDDIPEDEVARREDWRKELVTTIDPADAKDYDDAVLVKKLKDGGWELAVHIADVSHYVKPGSALDKEARERGNSTYLVDRVLPMLPEKLSNNMCSLVPNVDRLTKCAVMTFDKKGKRLKTRFVDAVIHTPAKFSYEEAQEVMMGRVDGGKVGASLREAWELGKVLRKRRFDNGSLDLDMPEVRVVLDPDTKKPIEVVKVVYDESHQMIEEFMLAANEAVAVALKMNRKNSIYRIHEDPDVDRLNEYAEQARIHGFKVGDLTNKRHIQELLDRAKGTPLEQSIKLGLLKSLKRAAYGTESLGHYGLSKQDYLHFTSPIRRYADLIVHRGLQGILENAPKKQDGVPKMKDLNEIAQHISDTERKSAEAENETKRMKMMEYLLDISKSGDSPVFEAMVTDVKRMGLFVEIMDMQVKGLVKKEDFGKGPWAFDAGMMRYTASGGREYKLGQKVDVKLAKVDIERQMVDFEIV